jgi:hypothetical protein
MKTSNILIITYLVVIFSGLIVLYIDDKLHYVKRMENPERYFIKSDNKKVEIFDSKVDLPRFTVIVDTINCSFSVTSGKNNELTVIDTIAKISPGIYDIRNDTLYISKMSQKVFSIKIVCADLKTIVARNNKSLTVYDFRSDALNMKLTKSRLAINNSKIGVFNLDLDNANCNARDMEINVLNGKFDNSHLDIHSSKIRRSIIEQVGDKKYDISIK